VEPSHAHADIPPISANGGGSSHKLADRSRAGLASDDPLNVVHADIPPISANGGGSSQNPSDELREGLAADVQSNLAQPLKRAAFGRRRT
jgi:hypothetical protein